MTRGGGAEWSCVTRRCRCRRLPWQRDTLFTMSHAAAPSTARGGRFAALSVPGYRLLFVSGTVSFVATQVQIIGRGWLANTLTGSNSGLGVVYLCFGVAMLISMPVGGVLADRRSRRALLIVSQAMFVGINAFVGIAVAAGFIRFWMLLITAILQAFGFGLLGPARMAMTVDIVGREHMANAVVLSQMSLNSARVVGPAVAGVGLGIAWFGTVGVYFTAAGLSLVGLMAVLSLPPTPRPSPSQTGAFTSFAEGISYARRERRVGLLLIGSTVAVVLGMPYLAFLPRVASSMFDTGPGGYGALSVASAVGAVAVSFAIANVGSGRRAWVIQWISAAAFAAGLAAMALAPTFATSMVAVLIVGAGSSAFQSMNGSIVLDATDERFHGRVQSLMMWAFGGFGMAALPLGALADAVGLRVMLAVIAVGVAVVAASMRLFAASSHAESVTDRAQ